MKTKLTLLQDIQIFLVILAFGLMSVFSFIFINNIEHQYLLERVEEIFSFSQSRIVSELADSKLLLENISETTRELIVQGNDSVKIQKYIKNICAYIKEQDNVSGHPLSGIINFYGFFDVFNGDFISGLDVLPDTENPDPAVLPWYKAAIEAEGGIVITQPVVDEHSGDIIITFARRLFTDDGIPLGILCMDMSLQKIGKYAVNTQLSEGGYGFITNDQFEIVAHTLPSMLGKKIKDTDSGLSIFQDELMAGYNISERTVTNYAGITSIVFIKNFGNDWYMGIVTPKDKYYQNTRNTAGFLLFLSLLFALLVYIILVRTITAKQESEKKSLAVAEKSREAEERALLMFYTMPLCCVFIDAAGTIIDCNQEAINLFDLSSKQEFIEKFLELSPEYQPDGILSEEREFEVVRQALETGYFRFEWTHQKLNGEQLPVEVTFSRVRYKGENVIIGYIRDLRELYSKIQEKSKAEIAEESSKTKSKFLAKMSHEIRTPLNSIIGITEIEMLNENLTTETKEALIRINNSSDLLLRIVNDILDLSKIETDNLVLVNDVYNIANLINDTVSLNISWAENKLVGFNLFVDENIPLEMIGDELRIKQILNNVLSNAFKYTEQGNVAMYVTSETQDTNTVMLSFRIIDTGQGMTEEQTNKIFDEFSRFNLEANRTIGGTGLGMNITYNLVRLMNGSISVKSKPNEGSEFAICLPQTITNNAVLGKEQAENLQQFHISNSKLKKKAQIAREYMPYGKVLIVDDVETNLYVARGLLSPYGLSTDSASSGFEAIEKIKEGNVYDIIFMDHMMPTMDGLEATKIIRGLNYTNPVVALTANAMAGQAEMLMQNGFDDFISKPIDIRQMNIVLNKLIRDKYPANVIENARQLKLKLDEDISEKRNQEDTELAEIFSRDAVKATAVLETISRNKYRRNDDIQMYVTTVHAMKSALANIGETDLSNKAFILEKAGREHDIDQIHDKTPEFLGLLEKIIEKLKPKEENTIEKDSDSDMAYLHEELMAIQKACLSYDKKLIRETLTGLREKKWSHNTKKVLDTLAEYILHSEFEAAADTAKKYTDLMGSVT